MRDAQNPNRIQTELLHLLTIFRLLGAGICWTWTVSSAGNRRVASSLWGRAVPIRGRGWGRWYPLFSIIKLTVPTRFGGKTRRERHNLWLGWRGPHRWWGPVGRYLVVRWKRALKFWFLRIWWWNPVAELGTSRERLVIKAIPRSYAFLCWGFLRRLKQRVSFREETGRQRQRLQWIPREVVQWAGGRGKVGGFDQRGHRREVTIPLKIRHVALRLARMRESVDRWNIRREASVWWPQPRRTEAISHRAILSRKSGNRESQREIWIEK